jgi:hypothetical protein
MLLAVAILATLAAVILPRFAASSLWGSQGDTAANTLVGSLRLARRMAIDHGAANATGYRLECGASSYRILDLAAIQYGPEQKLPDGWQFGPGSCTVTFNPYGAGLVSGSSDGCVVIRRTGAQWRVHVEPSTGRAWAEEVN